MVTPVLVDSFHLIPGTQVSGDKTLWVGKRSWKSSSNDKKMNKLKHGRYALFSDSTEDCSQKGVFSGGSEELFTSYKGSQNTNGQGLKTIQKAPKDYCGSKDYMCMIMIHLKLMIFMLLNNRYLFIFRILFICLLILAMLGLFC